MRLVTANMLSLAAFEDMLDDYIVAGTPFLGMTDASMFPYFVRSCIKHSQGIGLGLGVSPYTRYFLVDDDGRIYAQGDLRHKKTKATVLFQGQIGYGVLPSKRKCGYGTLICKLLLEEAKKIGFKDLIITCRDDNTGSQRIIEKNGGVLVEVLFSKKDNTYMRRYNVILD
ncbi:MAG: GNAT family N-acetyltransferase [Clostridiales bacterium]|nr:GNAT family N-acetyltransferase [Clostridiales bacterium]